MKRLNTDWLLSTAPVTSNIAFAVGLLARSVLEPAERVTVPNGEMLKVIYRIGIETGGNEEMQGGGNEPSAS